MDKVFQIHLAGVVFTIEEKAYNKLKAYSESLRRHFANQADVVQDIESRLAELLSERLGSTRNTLFTEDVDAVIGILGNVNQMDEHGAMKEEPVNQAPRPNFVPVDKKLRRDPYDQSLGGVCSGLAHFFDVDPVLVRVLFVLMLIAFGGGILLYVVLWITVPVAKGDEAFAMRMQKEHKSKKLFRDNDSRVVGGVASGLANYFALDVVWLRIAFVVALFVFGTGFWLYIILWIIVPKAISASDKLLMKGRTVDIHSIQQQVLETQNTSRVNSIAQHSTHLIGLVLKGIIKLFGSFLAIILFVMVISISIAMVSIFFNLGNTAQLNELIRFTVQDPSIVIAAKAGVFLCILTPIIAILMLVIRSLFKLSFANRAWFFSLLGLFLTGVVCLIYAGVSFGTSVNHNESKSSITRLAPTDSLFISGIDMEEDEAIEIENEGEVVFYDKGLIIGKDVIHFEIDDIKIKGSKNDSAYLKIIKRANGRDKQDAIDKIEMISYDIKIEGNKIQIPNFFQIHKSKQFSWQEIDVILVLPIGTVVHLDDISKENLDENNIDEADGHYYKVTSNGLSCIDCVYDENDITIDDSIEIDENEVKDVDIKIEGKDGDKMTIKVEKGGEGKFKKVTTKTKGEKKVRIEETQIGPVKITKETTINK